MKKSVLKKFLLGSLLTFAIISANCLTGSFAYATTKASNPNYVVVAKDGTGDFTTITAAYNSLSTPTGESDRKTIYVKDGVYKEQLTISKPYISIVGEDPENTILTYNVANGDAKPSGGVYGSADCAALTVSGNDFKAQNITFENSHLKDTGKDVQASCVYTYGDRISFSNCNFYSGQDTLCAYSYGANKSRVYFKNCFIQGSVDFIWGGATALFENCTLNELRSNAFYTAANTPQGQKYGFVFLNCNLEAVQDSRYTSLVNPSWGTPTSVYLGRTYGDYCHVSYIDCNLNAPINPLGWQKMSNFNLNNTAILEEYGCIGEGSNRSGRVAWSKALTSSEADSYTKQNILEGNDNWQP